MPMTNAECHRASRYKVTPEMYAEMLEAQNGVCAICKKSCERKPSLAVDHDHNCCPGNRSCGKCVRGLLCQRCNTMLGHIKESPEWLANAITYIVGGS